MKLLASDFPLPGTSSRLLAGVLVVLAVAVVASATGDSGPAIQIGVRSSVDERWEGFRKLGAVQHGKVYAIVSVNLTPSAAKLIAPVNEARLVDLLRVELNARGFSEITPEQTPDIVLTLLYGRGFLRNPYLKGAMVDEHSDVAVVSTIVHPDQAMRQREFGYEAKLQGAQQEKLFIRVTAWKYPGSPKEKPASLWKTTMVLDAPHIRDLNDFSQAMLAAGADFFDRQVKEEEVRIDSTNPGRVVLGPIEVLDTEPDGK